jgi:hypothetical protein
MYYWKLTWGQVTLSGSITNITLKTRALWNMIENITDGIDATGSRARIFTLGIDASQACGAVSVEDALGPAGEVGVTKKSGQTFACGCTAEF